MEIKIDGIKDKDILTIRAATLNQRTLDQLRELKSKELAELKDRLSRWLGYVIEPIKSTSTYDLQVTWMLAMLDGQTLIKARDSEYFWILRGLLKDQGHEGVQAALRKELDELPQIFIG